MKRKILTAIAALSLVCCVLPMQGCFDYGYPGYGYGGGYPVYSSGPWYGPEYVGHPAFAYYGHGWSHDGWARGRVGHDGFAGGHVGPGPGLAHSGHGESHHRG